jgi:antitoxin HicB
MNSTPLTFTLILEPADGGGFIVTVPALPELATEGLTRQLAIENAREQIEAAIAERRLRGDAIPADVMPEIVQVSLIT